MQQRGKSWLPDMSHSLAPLAPREDLPSVSPDTTPVMAECAGSQALHLVHWGRALELCASA